MSSLLKNVVGIPCSVGKWLAEMPFPWRIGREYVRTKTECVAAKAWRNDEVGLYAIGAFNLKENTVSWHIRLKKDFVKTLPKYLVWQVLPKTLLFRVAS